MKKLAYIFFIAVFFSGCITVDQTTVTTFSDYRLCEFLTPRYISTSDERMAIASELKKDKELYIHLNVMAWDLFFIANRLNRSSFSISG